MKNHFFIGWMGNKREEVENLYNQTNFEGIENIIEPFCGTAAFSYYISTKHPKKFKYFLNDVNKYLVELLTIAKDPVKLKKLSDDINNIVFKDNVFISKEQYKIEIKKDTLVAYMIMNKYYTIRAGLYPLEGNRCNTKINLENAAIVKFLREEDVEITNEDAVKIIEDFKNFDDCLFFLDPPYLQCNNSFYDEINPDYTANKKYMNIYQYLSINNIEQMKSTVMLILEDNWIIKLLFNSLKEKIISYEKKYQTTKRTTKHLLIKNKNNIIV